MIQVTRVGVVGTGFGAQHVEVLRDVPGAEVAAVCSARMERAEDVAARFEIPFATDDHRALIERVDAVVIVTPPALHAPIALDAAAAGKHIFCEKPMATSVAEARAMRDAAADAGIVHMLNFQQRFTDHFGRAAAMSRSEEIGRLLVADMRVTMNPVDYMRLPFWSDSKANWFVDASQGGGLLGSSVGPHLVDLLCWIGGPVAEVAARTIVSRSSIALETGTEISNVSAEDGFLILGRYASGALLSIRGVPVAHGGNEWLLELHGDAGSIVVDDNVVRLARAGDDQFSVIPLPEPRANPRVAIAARFFDAIRSGGPSPSPTFDDGLIAQTLLDAGSRAARSGEWVAVEEIA